MVEMVNCELCQDSGLEPIFEHVSFPVYSPAQQQVRLEPFEFERWPRQWEETEIVHQLLESFTICECPAGHQRVAAMNERKTESGKKGWQPRRQA